MAEYDDEWPEEEDEDLIDETSSEARKKRMEGVAEDEDREQEVEEEGQEDVVDRETTLFRDNAKPAAKKKGTAPDVGH